MNTSSLLASLIISIKYNAKDVSESLILKFILLYDQRQSLIVLKYFSDS